MVLAVAKSQSTTADREGRHGEWNTDELKGSTGELTTGNVNMEGRQTHRKVRQQRWYGDDRPGLLLQPC